MKIIDTHTHLPGTLLGAPPRDIADMRKEYEGSGLAAAWIFTTDGLIKDAARHNTLLADAVKEHRDFFLPFCTVNPHDGPDAALQELERCALELGMRGLKLHPWLQAFSLTNPSVPPILRRAGELGLPVIYHDGSPPYSTPLQIAYAAELAPKTTMILGHAGLDDLVEDAIRACLRHPNVYLSICGPSPGFIAQIARRAPPERLLFGSDAGFAPGAVPWYIQKIRSVVSSERLLRMIFHENAERLLAHAASAAKGPPPRPSRTSALRIGGSP